MCLKFLSYFNHNLQICRKPKFGRGFTLIELLIVIGIFVVITTVVVGILVTVLRGARTSDSVIEVRQNGEYAMSQIVNNLRYAQSLDSPNPVGGASPACSPGGLVVSAVIITTTSQNQITISCPSSFNPTNFIDMNGTKLTNPGTVYVKGCNLTCTQPAAGPPTIGIKFTLSKINSNGLIEGNVTMPFQSSVTLRNIGI